MSYRPTGLSGIGEFHHNTVELVAGREIQHDAHLQREVGARLIEEVVELCLGLGLSTQDIFAHVSDAIYNETRKRGTFYPSELGRRLDLKTNIKVELADVEICTEYARFVSEIRRSDLDEYKLDKVELIRRRALAGELTMVGTRLYKKEARR